MTPTKLRAKNLIALFLLACLSSYLTERCCAQGDQQEKVQHLAEQLAAVRTPEEGNALLKSQPELVTPDLVKALTKQARELATHGKQIEALMICDLALNIAQRLNDRRGMFRIAHDVILSAVPVQFLVGIRVAQGSVGIPVIMPAGFRCTELKVFRERSNDD